MWQADSGTELRLRADDGSFILTLAASSPMISRQMAPKIESLPPISTDSDLKHNIYPRFGKFSSEFRGGTALNLET